MKITSKTLLLSILVRTTTKRGMMMMMMMIKMMILNLDKVGLRKLAKEVHRKATLPMPRKLHHHLLPEIIQKPNKLINSRRSLKLNSEYNSSS